MQSVEPTPASAVDGSRLGLGVLCTVLGGVCWGFSGACAQFLFSRYGADPRWVVCVRLAGACVVFIAVSALTDRGRLLAALRSPRAMARISGYSLGGLTLCMVCYLNAIDASNAGTATVLQALNLLIILAVTCVSLRRRPTAKEAAGVALALAGTFLLATHGHPGTLAITPRALGWGLATAVAAALYTLLPVRLLNEFGSAVTTGLAMLVGAAASWALFRPWQIAPSLDAPGALAVACIVLVGTVAAYFLFLTGVRRIGSMLAGLFGSTEPITAGVLSAVWLGTQFAPADLAGMAMIVAMMVLMA